MANLAPSIHRKHYWHIGMAIAQMIFPLKRISDRTKGGHKFTTEVAQ
jgi:hypothetical protein